LKRSLRWLTSWFGSGSRCVGLGIGFAVDEGLIWLRVKVYAADDGVFSGWGVDLAQSVVQFVHSDTNKHHSKLSDLEKESRLFLCKKGPEFTFEVTYYPLCGPLIAHSNYTQLSLLVYSVHDYINIYHSRLEGVSSITRPCFGFWGTCSCPYSTHLTQKGQF
jgi:hypothetical protein